jgi:hypothetical protein
MFLDCERYKVIFPYILGLFIEEIGFYVRKTAIIFGVVKFCFLK